jgi:hypothetical protein
MSLLTGCGKTISAQRNFDNRHVWDKPGLSGDLVCFVDLVHLVDPVSLVQPNKQDKPNKLTKRGRPDRPNRPNEQDRLADFFSILLRDG